MWDVKVGHIQLSSFGSKLHCKIEYVTFEKKKKKKIESFDWG